MQLSAAQLVTALDGNLGIITNGKLNGSDVNKLPRFAYIKPGVNNKVYLKCAVFTVADSAVTVAMSDSDYVETAYLSSVASTKIY